MKDENKTKAQLIEELNELRQREVQSGEDRGVPTQQQRLNYILQGTNVGTWEWNVQTGETRFNERWAEIIGYTLEEISPVSIDTWMSFCHPDDLETSDALLQQCFKDESPYYECEARMKHKNGEWVWVLDRGKVASWTEDGKPLWMYGTHADITERKQAEETVEKAQQELETIMDATPSLVFYKDGENRFVRVNKALAEARGLSKEQIEGGSAFDLFPELAQDYWKDDQEVMASGCPKLGIIETMEGDDGKTVWVQTDKIPYKNEEGEIIGIIGFATDITDRKRREEELKETHARISTLLSTIRSYVYMKDENLNYVTANESLCDMLGVSKEEIEGKDDYDFFPEEDAESYRRDDRKVVETGKPVIDRIEKVPIGDGNITWNLTNKRPIKDNDGNVIGLVGQTVDITEHKQTEETLRESEEQFKSFFTYASIGIAMAGLDGRFVQVNDALCEMLGYAEQELLSKTFQEITHPDDLEEDLNNVDCLLAGEIESFQMEKRYIGREENIVWVSLNVSIVRGIENEPMYFIGCHIDITDRKRMEEEIRRAYNLESLGLLAGGIAHDFNNVLTGVMGNLALLLRFLDKDSEEYEIANEAQQAATKTKGLTQQLMTFAKGGAPVKETASVEELIRETTNRSLPGANTKPEFDFADDLSSVDIDTGQIGQVMQNLVINADQAMPNGGTLKISAENVGVSNKDSLPLAPGNYVKVTVADQGVGIPESILAQVFDPYFSTKEAGHGLGLSITYSIMQRHEGHITVSSEQNIGTTFEFYLPASEKQEVPVTETEQDLARGSGRILLVDDEETIHQTVGRVLEALGYDVSSAYDGEEALQMYKAALESEAPFDVVIMDLTIPGGMGGKEAVGRLREIDPQVRVIVSSGYANDPVMANYAEYGFTGRVAKPVDIEELAGTVKSVLERGE